MALLELEQITKSFHGQKVLQDLTFSVAEGSIYGFVGRNGAGKTTTMKLITGLLKQDAGAIRVNQNLVTYGQNQTNQFIGYLPDVPAFYDYLTAKEYLNLCGEIAGLKRERFKRSEELLQLVGLTATQRIGGFSRGMKQRLGIAQALVNEPKLLLCDEPTSALDPIGRKEFLDLLASLRQKTTILFSTHILHDVEQICDHVGILNRGEMQVTGTLEDLKQQYGKKQWYVDFDSITAKNKFLSMLSEKETFVFQNNEQKSDVLLTVSDDQQEQLWYILRQQEKMPVSLQQQESTLEDIFLEVTK
ncbi:hypothetical protein RU97_GL000177 [Enterococcus canis]|uniref:ABC transporter domain-containing protein n=1 Tax=Enterococcus canis TaxID=214095 RepID=A0A1L8RJQ9_9ENTE|nr:ABC transporter ATP-binding protein [Enterococcus canis]OJG19944.1 hypothetical protein RU97_GL000177 [Enterococcus canis]